MVDDFENLFAAPTRHRVTVEAARVIDYGPGGEPRGGSSVPIGPRYASWLWFAIFLLLVVLVVRLGWLQTVVGGTYRLRADQNRIRIQSIPAPRGQILDRHGQPFVNNVANYVLTIIPADLPRTEPARSTTFSQLSQASGLSVEAIKQTLSSTTQRVTDPLALAEYVPQTGALTWLAAVQSIPGASLQVLPTRQYVDGPASAALLGYIGKVSQAELSKDPKLTTLSLTGKTGLERVYNNVLTGRDGEREVERDVRNQEQRVLNEIQPEPGQTVQVGLDRNLQIKAAAVLNATVEKFKSPGGAVVAVDPNTGDILALASAPSYDNNWFVEPNRAKEITSALTDNRKLLLNRAISGQYPSGSIIKPFIATAGLEEKIITPQTTVLSVGGFKVGNNTFPDWKPGGHGVTNLSKALAESVNTYFYILGGGYQDRTGLGVDRIVSYLQRFGWGRPSGIDLPSEAPGFLPTKDWRDHVRPTPWRLGDTYHLSIGQGDLDVTPLQVAMAMSAIANNGTLYQPRLATKILNPDGSLVRSIPTKVVTDRIASTANIQAVQAGLREGVLNGSSRSLQSLPVAAAGKTGTAQFGADGKTHSWYSAYAPFDAPTIAIAVVIEAGGEGNDAALPVAKEILDWYFRNDQANSPVDNVLTAP